LWEPDWPLACPSIPLWMQQEQQVSLCVTCLLPEQGLSCRFSDILQGSHYYYWHYFVVLGFELRAYNLSYSTSPLFCVCDGYFEIGSCELFAQVWLGTEILLISASWVTRITGVSCGALQGSHCYCVTS
jgi:hypothetical protein